ncbi:MAG: sigma-E processing peptidase SpoIIGA [Clostridiales bacterium]|nr:sigma-E processing peptidase SpoIIGA [Clostridiales bacterium]
MRLDVYADVVFLINFALDFLILAVAGNLVRIRTKLWRLAFGAAVMAFLYCLVVFVTYFHIFYHLIFSVIMLIIGIGVAFIPIKPLGFLKLVLFSYISAFLIGGAGMALFYGTQFYNLPGSIAGTNVVSFSLPILLASVAAFYVLFRFLRDWMEHRALKRQICMPVKIFFDELNVELNALVDTGNSLREPISQAPVIVAEFDTVKVFLPDRIKLIFYEKQENDLNNLLEFTQDNFSHRIRMIPYESLGQKNGMLIGFRPDKVEIRREKDVLTLKEVVIGVYNFALSRDGDYQGLLNPELIA